MPRRRTADSFTRFIDGVIWGGSQALAHQLIVLICFGAADCARKCLPRRAIYQGIAAVTGARLDTLRWCPGGPCSKFQRRYVAHRRRRQTRWRRRLELGFRFDSVWVVESLRPGDPKTGEKLFDDVIVPAASRWSDVHVNFRQSPTRVEFATALHEIAESAESEFRWPVIHLETHGSPAGVELGSGEFVTWRELREPITRINRATRLNLVVTLAACSGAEMIRVLSHLDAAPFLYVSGPRGRRKADDLLLDFSAFYSEFLSSLNMRSAFDLLNGTDHPEGWTYPVLSAEFFFRAVFREYLGVDCTEEELIDRENEIVAKIARREGPNLARLPVVRDSVRSLLRDHTSHFNRLRRRFFMIDQFPENDGRFAVAWEDMTATEPAT